MENRLIALMKNYNFPETLLWVLYGDSAGQIALDGTLHSHHFQRRAPDVDRFGGIDNFGDLVLTPGSALCHFFGTDS